MKKFLKIVLFVLLGIVALFILIVVLVPSQSKTDPHEVKIYTDKLHNMNKQVKNRLSEVSSAQDANQIKNLTDEYFHDVDKLAPNNISASDVQANERQVFTVYGQAADEYADYFNKLDLDKKVQALKDIDYANNLAQKTEADFKNVK